MKIISLYTFLFIVLSSCTIRFDRVPKNVLSEFPKEMQGKYLFTSRQNTDSTYVTITTNTLRISDQNIMEGGGLSDSLKLAQIGNYYFICQLGHEKDRKVWDIYPTKYKDNKLYIHALAEDRNKKAYSKYFKKVDGFENLYEMNDAKMEKFCKRKLKKKEALKLIRVN